MEKSSSTGANFKTKNAVPSKQNLDSTRKCGNKAANGATTDSKIRKITADDCIHFYGVDVSMDELVVARKGAKNDYKLFKYANIVAGIAKFMGAIEKNGEPKLTLVVLEATGTYSMKLSFALTEAQIPTAVLNPKQSKGFISGVLLSTTKTDDKDACALALYGMINRPKIYKLPDTKVLEIRQLRNLLSTLKKDRGVYINNLHALEHHPKSYDYVVTHHSEMLSMIEKRIAEIEEKLCKMSKENFDKLYKLAKSVKGIGPATASALLILTNGCTEFTNVKQLAKFIGICPTQRESGKSIRGRGAMSKTGPKEVRALLYMCARSAKRYNIACKDLYERLKRKGKCHKVAMNAVAHKLVKQFFAVIKTETMFDNEFHLKKKQI